MKKLFLCFSLFMASLIYAQQSGEVIYKVKQDKSYNKADRFANLKKQIGEDMVKRIIRETDQNYQLAQDFDYILRFNATQSLYQWDESMPDETIPKSKFLSAVRLGGKGPYYRDLKKKLFFEQFKISGVYKRMKYPYKAKWQITKETDTILGYPVIKAVAGQTSVWFTPHIPVPFGPSKYAGLPGLILKFQYHGRVIVAEKIKLFKKAIRIKMPYKGDFTTESAVIKAYQKADAKRWGN